MKKTIEGSQRSSILDILIIVVVAYLLFNQSLAIYPLWVVAVLALIVLGFAVSLFRNRRRGVVVKYDEDYIEAFTDALMGEPKKTRVAWRKVYGIDILRDKKKVGLIGENGDVLLSIPADWKGLPEFTSVVLGKLDAQQQSAEQLDFYVPRYKFGIFTPAVITVLSLIITRVLTALFFTPEGESIWQATQVEISILLVVIGIGLWMQSFRLRSLHIDQNKLELRYPLITRRLHYTDIANVELVEDPSRPVADKTPRLRINLKGRSRHYIVSEFPNRVETIFSQVDRRVRAGR